MDGKSRFKQALTIAGWTLAGLALVLVALDIAASFSAGAVTVKALGERWFAVHPSSLNLLQAVTQRYIHPAVWDPAITSVLLAPSWLVPALLGGLLVWLGRR